jgi:capsular exopolysaccharide synthesis family protein
MKFLKALQKSQSDGGANKGAADAGANDEEVAGPQFPEVLGGDIKIGGPNSVIRRTGSAAVIGEAAEVASEVESAAIGILDAAAIRERKHFREYTVDPAAINPHLVAITHPQSAYCEEYRSLRTHVLHKSQEQHLQSIVIASVGPGEGKSVTALNLAWLLAQTEGVNALVIDSDLRMPSLAKYLGIESEIGLSDVLDGNASLDNAIIQLKPAGLHVMPGGHARGDVAELLSGTVFKEILRETREMFDYVIIDAPPLAIFTDADVLINHADGALLVVKANQTKYKDIDRILNSLPRKRLLGTILNQSDDSFVTERYYGYSDYRKLLSD